MLPFIRFGFATFGFPGASRCGRRPFVTWCPCPLTSPRAASADAGSWDRAASLKALPWLNRRQKACVSKENGEKKTLGNKKKQNGEAEGSACGRLGKAGDKSERLGVPVSNPWAVGCGLGGWSASETNGNRPLEQSCYYIRRIKVPVVGAENEYSYCVFGRRSLARSQPQ